jgi:tyrosyl-tRNA synthetase
MKLLTFLPLEQIREMDSWEGEELNKAKEILAFELTAMIHGTDIAEQVQKTSKALFSSGGAADMPSVTLSEADFEDGVIDILTLLIKSGLCASRGDARRNIDQGGVEVDGKPVSSITTEYKKEDCSGEGIVIKRGKKNYRRVVV